MMWKSRKSHEGNQPPGSAFLPTFCQHFGELQLMGQIWLTAYFCLAVSCELFLTLKNSQKIIIKKKNYIFLMCENNMKLKCQPINNILLAHSNARSFTYGLWVLSSYNGRAE